MFDQVFDYFAQPQNGILGVIVIMLLITIGGLIKVIYSLAKRADDQAKAKDEEIKLLNIAINVLQEKRIADYDKNSGNLLVLGKDLINNDLGIQKSIDRLVNLFELKKLQ